MQSNGVIAQLRTATRNTLPDTKATCLLDSWGGENPEDTDAS